MKPLAALIAGIALIGATSPQRESIGIYQGWGAFRDSPPTHCYAIAQPVRPRGSDAFAAIGDWPTLGRRGEVHDFVWTGAVASGENVRRAGSHVGVADDAAVLGLDAGVLESE